MSLLRLNVSLPGMVASNRRTAFTRKAEVQSFVLPVVGEATGLMVLSVSHKERRLIRERFVKYCSLLQAVKVHLGRIV